LRVLEKVWDDSQKETKDARKSEQHR
jgi:hypothetical protein